MSIASRARGFFIRQATSPFETTLAFFFMYAAIAGIFSFGVTVTPLSKVLGPALSKVLYAIYFMSGFAMYFGIGLGRGDLESFGLILLVTCLTIIVIVSGWLFGLHPATINGYIFNSAFIFCCIIRLCSILKIQAANS